MSDVLVCKILLFFRNCFSCYCCCCCCPSVPKIGLLAIWANLLFVLCVNPTEMLTFSSHLNVEADNTESLEEKANNDTERMRREKQRQIDREWWMEWGMGIAWASSISIQMISVSFIIKQSLSHISIWSCRYIYCHFTELCISFPLTVVRFCYNCTVFVVIGVSVGFETLVLYSTITTHIRSLIVPPPSLSSSCFLYMCDYQRTHTLHCRSGENQLGTME